MISAFVATVVPWQNSAVRERSMPASSTPAITPSIGIFGRGDLRHGQLAAGLVENTYVGEGAADVDGDHASRFGAHVETLPRTGRGHAG